MKIEDKVGKIFFDNLLDEIVKERRLSELKGEEREVTFKIFGVKFVGKINNFD